MIAGMFYPEMQLQGDHYLHRHADQRKYFDGEEFTRWGPNDCLVNILSMHADANR
jgi:hypothetical protein